MGKLVKKRVKKYKTYLFICPENRVAYRRLASREWEQGDLLVLPPIRVRAEESWLFGNQYYLHLEKMPTIFLKSGYLPKGAYRIYHRGGRRWKLVQIG